MFRFHTIICCCATFALAANAARAYNPPVETVGPLTVRIEGPETVTQTDAPLPVRVVFENKGPQPITGTVVLGLADRWRAEPAGATAFTVAAGAKAERAFSITAGRPTYSGHYPIHALVKFALDGKPQTAHPILVFETKLPPVERSAPRPEWRPFRAAADRELTLWRLPVRRAVIEVFGRPKQVMPVGWQGSEPESKAHCQVQEAAAGGQKRECLSIHPPWNQGRVGTALVEYPLELPASKPIGLRFAAAMSPEGKGGDGVTFRVRVAAWEAAAGEFGKVVFERHSAAKKWEDATADLSAFAGQKVRLQFESHPGPKNDTSFDHSFWAEPTLVCGAPPASPAFPPPDETGSRAVGGARLWPGQRGLLDATIALGSGPQRVYLRGFEVRVLGVRIDDGRGPVVCRDVSEEPCPHGCQFRHRFESVAGPFDLVGRAAVEGGALRVRFWIENAPPPQPWQHVHLEDVAVAEWSRLATHVYAGHGNVIRAPEGFSLGFDGHRLATSFVGLDFDGLAIVQACDLPPDRFEVRPERKHYSLHVPHGATLTFVPAADAWSAVRRWRDANGLKPAGGVTKLAGRFVFDLWGGRYGEAARSLDRAFRYGLTDACVVWHNWQRWGYDYRLPDIMPPNPQLGTTAELRAMSDLCRKHGVLWAPHDNYIDFYPDAEGFSYEKQIAFSAGGEPIKAWLNEHRGARSYRFRADTLSPFLRRNVEWIRRDLAPSAFFIDVWSSAGPYDYWTADGQFVDRVRTRTTWGEEFAWIRGALGDDAPQISESGHDQLIGWLDGAQTNHLRVGPPLPGRHGWCVWNWKCADAERTPWLDAAHHDRFILHGAGYPGRYDAGLDPRLHGIYSDDYIATEALTGHPGMVPHPFGRDVVRKYWLLQEMMRALALRQIERVEFADDDLHRQRVVWSNGDVWVNRGERDWQVAGRTLPQYGFFARLKTEAGTVEAAICRRDGTIVEEVVSPRQVYVNGRQMIEGPERVALAVEKAQLKGERRVEFALQWDLAEPVRDEYRGFLHLCDAEGEIVSHLGFDPGLLRGKRGRVQTPASAELPRDARPGASYELRFGFYRPQGGARLELAGADDGTRRIRAGTLRMDGAGEKLSAVTWTPHAAGDDPWLARQNPAARPIDFGAVTTAGGVRLAREGDALVLTPLPAARGPKLAVRLRPAKLPWRLPELATVETMGEDGATGDPQPLQREGDALLLDCAPGVFAYRLRK